MAAALVPMAGLVNCVTLKSQHQPPQPALLPTTPQSLWREAPLLPLAAAQKRQIIAGSKELRVGAMVAPQICNVSGVHPLAHVFTTVKQV